MRLIAAVRETLRAGGLAVLVMMLVAGGASPAVAASPWLFVNDIHLDPDSDDPYPVRDGVDTNPPLLTSALNEMRRVAPHPPVVVMAGDFLSHYRHPDGESVEVMRTIARRFRAAFPDAQFVLALGNEDAHCGDYKLGPNSPFLRAVVQAWAPLVNRRGAAPDFAHTFAHDGFYTARLPLAGVRAVVIDDAYFSPFYRNACERGDPTPGTLDELNRALAPAGRERRWVIMHIPPGIDVSSTRGRTKHLAIVPFLRPDPREVLVRTLTDPQRRVELVVSAHIHRFAYRILDAQQRGAVPLLVSPAISPIFHNSPSFLTADVASDGRVLNLEEHSDVNGTWKAVGGLSDLGASAFTVAQLLGVQHRLERSRALRERYSDLYTGGSDWREITERNWRQYWCATTNLTATTYRGCLDEGGFSVFTTRGVEVLGAAAAAALAVLGAAVFLVVRVFRRRRRASD